MANSDLMKTKKDKSIEAETLTDFERLQKKQTGKCNE
jgi:hypothetical protein